MTAPHGTTTFMARTGAVTEDKVAHTFTVTASSFCDDTDLVECGSPDSGEGQSCAAQ